MNLIGWDSETTGVDLYHGAAPLFVSAYVEAEEVHHFWEWSVNPLTREVEVPPGDLQEIADLWNQNEAGGGLNIFQNPKFDVGGFKRIGLWELLDLDKAWLSIRCTLLAGHLLASSLPHNLTDMVVQYLGINIEPYETALKIACNEARRYARSKFPEWRIAKEGLPEMPSAKSGSHKDKKGIESDSPWKFDTWLPRTLVKHLWETSESFKIWTSGKKHAKLSKLWPLALKRAVEAPGWEYHPPEVDPKDAHPWWTVLSEYGNTDTAVCPPLWRVMEKEIKSRGLWEIYLERLKVLPVTHRMESHGVTANKTKKDLLVDEYLEESAKCASICVNIAADNNYELVLPKGGLNNSLRQFCFEVLKLPPRYSKKSKTGAPTLDKVAMEYYEATLPARSEALLFVKSLKAKKKRDTMIAYMEGYEKYWQPWEGQNANSTEIKSKDREETDRKVHSDGGVLGVASQHTQEWRVRSIYGSGGVQSPSGDVSTVQGVDPRGVESLERVRQSKVCKPETLISRNKQRKLGGHGSEGQTGIGGSERFKTTPRETTERRQTLDKDKARVLSDGGQEWVETAPGEQAKGGGTSACDRSELSSQRGGSRQLETNRGASEDVQKQGRESGENREAVWGETVSHQCNNTRDNLETRKVGTEWFVLHPSLNSTGTDTLRWSSSNPNEQNISKQGMFEGDPHTLRYLFGPAPGREWWSCDAKNIELRLPAYEAGEKEMIELFEHPNDPPYYGSNHLLNFHTVYPDLWDAALKEVGFDKVGPYCKKKYASSWYQRCKNGGFAVQYGATDRVDGRGTADIAFGKPGSHALLKSRFRMLETLNRKCIAYANKYGYVETMPDRTVNPLKGYPLICSRTENGGILPTVPLNYRIQSTAMDWMNKAMVRCDSQLGDWRKTGFDGWLIMQVHDEMVFDLPKQPHPKVDLEQEKTGKWLFRTSNSSNLWRMRIIQNLMEQGGENLIPRVPTPVGIEYHEDNWASGFTVA